MQVRGLMCDAAPKNSSRSNDLTNNSVYLYKNLVKKIFYLDNCTTSQAIIRETGINEKNFEMQDIKFEKITPAQIDEMKKMIGSYEALFSRRALKYKELKLKDKKLDEKDYRKYILEEYTFLKRPVVIVNDKIFAGSEKKTIAALKKALQS